MIRPLLKSLPSLFVLALAVGCAAPQQTAPGGPGQMSPFEFISSTVWFILIAIFVYYMLVLRPEAVESENREKFISELKKNDEVVTSGGLIGKVHTVKDDSVTVEIAPNVRVRVLPSMLRGRRKEAEGEAKK